MNLLSTLIIGPKGSGKTAFISKIAIESGIPFVKMIHPDDFVGLTTEGKVYKINKIFNDAYKSKISLILIDDIERLVEFIQLKNDYTKPILTNILTLLKKKPQRGHKIFILGTSSNRMIMENLEIADCFVSQLQIDILRKIEEKVFVINKISPDTLELNKELAANCPDISVRNLIILLESTIQMNQGALSLDSFNQIKSTMTQE